MGKLHIIGRYPFIHEAADMPLTHLERLEAESIDIFREAVSEAENPVML